MCLEERGHFRDMSSAEKIKNKMTVHLEACAREEQRAVVHFLGCEGEKHVDIHRRMQR